MPSASGKYPNLTLTARDRTGAPPHTTQCADEGFLQRASVSLTQRTSQDTVNIYLCKVNNRNTKKRCDICSKVTTTPERRH